MLNGNAGIDRERNQANLLWYHFCRAPSPAMRALVSLIVCAVLVAGCGYKGPLYLPKDKPGAKKTAQKPAPQQDVVKPAEEP